jgi:hypothetical protein
MQVAPVGKLVQSIKQNHNPALAHIAAQTIFFRLARPVYYCDYLYGYDSPRTIVWYWLASMLTFSLSYERTVA